MKQPQERSANWANNPEPSLPEADPRTILDCNISGQAWLWHSHKEETAWLVYEGEPAELVR